MINLEMFHYAKDLIQEQECCSIEISKNKAKKLLELIHTNVFKKDDARATEDFIRNTLGSEYNKYTVMFKNLPNNFMYKRNLIIELVMQLILKKIEPKIRKKGSGRS